MFIFEIFDLNKKKKCCKNFSFHSQKNNEKKFFWKKMCQKHTFGDLTKSSIKYLLLRYFTE